MTKEISKKGFSSLFNLQGEPRIIAKGFALGSFIGMMPVPGFQMFISATIAAFLRWNKAAAIVGVFIKTNIATGVFSSILGYYLTLAFLTRKQKISDESK